MKKQLKIDKSTDDLVGRVLLQKSGNAFVRVLDSTTDVFVAGRDLRGAVNDDLVQLRLYGSRQRERREGEVIAILERSKKVLVGRVLREAGRWLVNVADGRYQQNLLLQKTSLTLQPELMVSVQLVESTRLDQLPMVKVLEALGMSDDAAMEIEVALRKFDLPHEFSLACKKQVARLPDEVRPSDELERKDLTALPLVTIDGEDARDFDDAVFAQSIKVNGKKAFRLLVAIADVSHYVKPNTALNADAIDRATSVYFPRRVIPMLPEKLSNGLCSLNPHVKRLAMVADMKISLSGAVLSYEFYPAVIRSHARLTYTEVAELLAQPNATYSPELTKLKPHLLELYAVYQVLQPARQRRGALDFDVVETQMRCDDSGKIISIEPRTRNDAHRLIEESMLVANICAAEFILQSKRIGIFRVHDQPSSEKILALKDYLTSLAVPFKLSDQPAPHELQTIAQAVKDRPDAQQIHMMLLRCMAQAVYTPDNIGHYGLAYPAYTHFTSPIRRYPDLLVHRVIKAILQHQTYQLSLPKILDRERAKDYVVKLQPGYKTDKAKAAAKHKISSQEESWQLVAAHCSMNERRADEASLEVQAWLKCQYMQQFIGDEFTASVTSVTSFGLFVTLQEYFVDGLIHITELGSDFFTHNPQQQSLVGNRTGAKFGMGQELKVRLVRVDMDSRQMDFVLATADSANQPAGKRRSRPEPLADHAGKNGSNRAGNKASKTKQNPGKDYAAAKAGKRKKRRNR